MKFKAFTGIFLFIFSFLVGAIFVAAHEKMRPANPSQLPLGTKEDLGYKVKNAQVVAFNRIALERDFPHLKGRTDHEIKTWILENFAFINSLQLGLNSIRNTDPEVDYQNSKPFFIPPGVGRGAVVNTNNERGMVDLKATGNSSWNLESVDRQKKEARYGEESLKEVRASDHSNGLETYDLMTAEYLRQIEIQHEYEQTGGDMETVEGYFLIDYGFNLIYPEGEIPAFFYGRQAHFGRTAYNGKDKESYTDKGQYQETYTQSRIDFGGSRTASETKASYHDRLKKVDRGQAATFVNNELARIQKLKFTDQDSIKRPKNKDEKHQEKLIDLFNSGDRKELAEFVSLLLEQSDFNNQKAPAGAAIDRTQLDMMNKAWIIDPPKIATIKWILLQLREEELNSFLGNLKDKALENLFKSSINEFQLPLPKAVYEYGI